jgi:cytochrome c
MSAHPDRRAFLKGLGVVGASSVVTITPLDAVTGSGRARSSDVAGRRAPRAHLGGLAVSSPAMLALIIGTPGVIVGGWDADVEKGQAAFEQCAACHSLDEATADGPSLKGVFGRRAGSLEDYRYSVAMTRSAVVWDKATLDRYLTDPQAFMPGNRMAFAGMPDRLERDASLAYLEWATKR